MSLFVLVHGSWHDGSAWDPVIAHLEAKGHQAFGPTIAGHGKGVNKNVDHAKCTQSITDFIIKKNLQDIVLVGHSFGGTIISQAAPSISARIRRLVFWNAFVCNDGNSLMDEVPPHYRRLFSSLVEGSDDHTVTLPFPIWRDGFINDADSSLAATAYEQLSPEPFQPFLDKLNTKPFQALETPKSFLNCTEDIALPPGEWGWHPRMSGRLGLYRLVQMPGSHEVIFTNPIGLANKIIEAGRD